MGICGLARLDDLLLGVVPPQTICQILLDGFGEELGVLRDEAAEVSDASRRQLPHVPAIQKQGAIRGLVEPHQKVYERTLATSALADQRCRGPGSHVQVNALQDQVLRPRLVSELNALQLQVASDVLPAHGFASVGVHIRPGVDERDDTLGGGRGPDEVVEDVPERDEGAVHHVPVELVSDEAAQRHRLAHRVTHLGAAIPQNQDGSAQVQIRGEGRDRGTYICIPLSVRERRADVILVLLGLEGLRGEAPHRPDVVDGLGGDAVGLAICAVDRPVDVPAPLSVAPIDEGDGRHDGQRQHRQLPRCVKCHHHASHEEHQVRNEVVHERVQGLHHLTRIVRQPRGQLAGVHRVEEGDVHAHHALEELDAHAASELPQHQVLEQGFQPTECALHNVNAQIQNHGVLKLAAAIFGVVCVLNDSVEDLSGDVRRPDQHYLRADEADHRQDRDESKLQRHQHDALEVGPSSQLLTITPDRTGPVALRIRIVLLLVAARAEVEVARPAAVCDVVRALQ
mmetsp:Transcript_79518/g.207305  ORF Transcript_79518/g.207305 Transcript_79518/m.207305 type:complete len:512 (-) Transcript_79518:27-1562(-)